MSDPAGKPEEPTEEAAGEWLLEDAGEFDGLVGGLFEPAQGPPPEPAQVYVCASAGPSGSWAIGLEDSLQLLARAFAAGGTDLCRELIEDLPSRSPAKSRKQKKPDVHIALHGLGLDASEEEELRDLISALVEKRIAGEGARR